MDAIYIYFYQLKKFTKYVLIFIEFIWPIVLLQDDLEKLKLGGDMQTSLQKN